jgi:hypothetical protein
MLYNLCFLDVMKRKSCLILALLFVATAITSAQNLRLPRDPDKLIDSVQKFWTAMTTSQRSKALDFVLPEKRDLFLSGSPMPVLKAKVLGVDLTGKPEEALVRISLDVFTKESSTGFLTWTVTDPWIWKDGKWYYNMNPLPDVFPKGSPQSSIDTKKIQAGIEKNFQILRNPIDLGTLTDGQHFSVEVPIKYTGDLPLKLDIGLPNPLIGLDATKGTITSGTESFVLLVGTDDWDGPFTLPLPLKIRYESVSVERTLTVTGNVFLPVTFRQSPENGPVPEQQFSVFIRNNTDQKSTIHSVLVDGKMDLVKRPDALVPHGEVEVVFKPHPNETPDLLYLNLDTPIEGRASYIYHFPHVRH